LLATQGVDVIPVTLGGGDKWGPPGETPGTPFRAYVQKLDARQVTDRGRTATTDMYKIFSLSPEGVTQQQKLDVPGVGRLDVINVARRELGNLRAVLIEAERVT
jgi:hypothetical protein